jgi:hypothetical protein
MPVERSAHAICASVNGGYAGFDGSAVAIPAGVQTPINAGRSRLGRSHAKLLSLTGERFMRGQDVLRMGEELARIPLRVHGIRVGVLDDGCRRCTRRLVRVGPGCAQGGQRRPRPNQRVLVPLRQRLQRRQLNAWIRMVAQAAQKV